MQDNRRQFIGPKYFKGFDMSNNLFDTRPHIFKERMFETQVLTELPITFPYNKNNTINRAFKKHQIRLY